MASPCAQSIEEGIYAAVLTPVLADLRCDFFSLAHHCRHLIDRGCKGIVLFGTTGEGPSFSIKEKLETLEKLIYSGIDPKKIILSNSGANISETVELAHGACKLGIAALLLMPPYFFRNVPDEGVIAYYTEIIQRAKSPNLRILLYHIPQYSGVPITLKIIESLRARFPEIVIGIKESEGNLALTRSIIEAFPSFMVFVGKEKHITEAVHLGACGSICGAANLFPELMCSHYKQGKGAIPAPHQEELALFSLAQKNYPFIPMLKALMESKKGDAWHSLRPPLIPLTAAQREVLISSLGSDYGLVLS